MVLKTVSAANEVAGSALSKFCEACAGRHLRGGALDVVWSQFLALGLISAALFGVALTRFRRTIGSM